VLMNKAEKKAKVEKVMKEFKSGKLHSGKKGPVVKGKKQAVAIALSEAKMVKKKMGKKK
jgi:ABC-type Na+ transport system ATPase subunit NatA